MPQMNNHSEEATPTDIPALASVQPKPKRNSKMSSLNLNRNPEDISKVIGQFVRAFVQTLIWITIALASIAVAFIAARMIWAAVTYSVRLVS